MNKFPKIMGILNITPDSFSDGGDYYKFDSAVRQIEALIENGADIIDIGGESTRPGSEAVSSADEVARVCPVVDYISKNYKNIEISIDTTKYEVAEKSLDLGAHYINDISGLSYEPRLAELTAKYNAALIVMHIQGKPKDMQSAPHYDNLIQEVYDFLKNSINMAKDAGVKKIIADVGIGFGKSFDDNWELLRNHAKFRELGVELLLGISRKRFIGEFCKLPVPTERDYPTMLIHSMMLGENAPDYIRVHNVEMASTMREIYMKLEVRS